MTRPSSLVLRKPKAIKALVDETLELGVSSCDGTNAFAEALTAVGTLREDTFIQKFGVLKSWGWSQEEVLLAFKKNPKFVGLSEKNLRSKMEFLRGEVGLDASEIAQNATVLNLSLEKRLVPRNLVLRERKKLGKRNLSFGNAMMISEEEFVKKFILNCRDEVPDLYKIYIDARGGKVSI